MKKYSFLWGFIPVVLGVALLIVAFLASYNILALLIALTLIFAGLTLAVFLRVFASGKKYASPTRTFMKVCCIVQLLVCAIPVVSYAPVIISALLFLVLSVSTGMVQYKFGMPCEYLVKMGCAASVTALSLPLHIFFLVFWG